MSKSLYIVEGHTYKEVNRGSFRCLDAWVFANYDYKIYSGSVEVILEIKSLTNTAHMRIPRQYFFQDM